MVLLKKDYRRIFREIIGKTMTVDLLSNILMDMGFRNIYEYGTISENILTEKSITTINDNCEEIHITVRVIEELKDYKIAYIEVENIELI